MTPRSRKGLGTKTVLYLPACWAHRTSAGSMSVLVGGLDVVWMGPSWLAGWWEQQLVNNPGRRHPGTITLNYDSKESLVACDQARTNPFGLLGRSLSESSVRDERTCRTFPP